MVTAGPHSNPESSTLTGEAAHICAAAPGGPRYDPNQSPSERKHITNAIWLCSRCHVLVDKDATAFPKELLIEWKLLHEELVRKQTSVGLSKALGLSSSNRLATFVSPGDFFSRFLNRKRLFNHNLSLVGRQKQFTQLEDFILNDDLQIAFIRGRGGIGKSKLLHALSQDFARRHAGLELRFVPEGAPITPESIAELQRFTLVLHTGRHAGTSRGCPWASRGAAPGPRHHRARPWSWLWLDGDPA